MKRCKDRCLFCGWDADAGIANLKVQHDVRRIGRFADGGAARDIDDDFALLGKLDGIANQIGYDLPQPDRIADQCIRNMPPPRGRRVRDPSDGAQGEGVEGIAQRVAESEFQAFQIQIVPPRSWRNREHR